MPKKEMGRLGFEPRANALKGRCSTAELPTRGRKQRVVYHGGAVSSIVLSNVILTLCVFCVQPSSANAQDVSSDDRAAVRADRRRAERRSSYRSYFSGSGGSSVSAGLSSATVGASVEDGSIAREVTLLRRADRNKLWIPRGLDEVADWIDRWSMNAVSPWERNLEIYRGTTDGMGTLLGPDTGPGSTDFLTTMRGTQRSNREIHRVRSIFTKNNAPSGMSSPSPLATTPSGTRKRN